MKDAFHLTVSTMSSCSPLSAWLIWPCLRILLGFERGALKNPAAFDRLEVLTGWYLFFLTAIREQVEQNLAIADQIMRLHDAMKERFREVLASQWVIQALDFVFATPMFWNSRSVSDSGMPKAVARRATRALSDAGLLRTVVPAAGRRLATYAFDPLIEAVRV